MFSICFMRDDVRRRNFAAWFAGPPCRGDRAKLLSKTGLTKGRITQLLDDGGDEPFGERAAANLARKLGLPDTFFEGGSDHEPADGNDASRTIEDAYRDGTGWLGEDGIEMLTPQEVELVGIFRQIGPLARKLALEELRVTRDKAELEAEDLQRRLRPQQAPGAQPRSRDSGFAMLEQATPAPRKARRKT
jgi:hypothetical protein